MVYMRADGGTNYKCTDGTLFVATTTSDMWLIVRSHGARKCGLAVPANRAQHAYTVLSEIVLPTASFPYSLVWNEVHVFDQKLVVDAFLSYSG